MPIQRINYGAAPDDGTGDPLRVAFKKSDDNFVDLDNRKAEQSDVTTALGNKVDKITGYRLMTEVEGTKLADIAEQATKNATDAALRDRSTHTGTQPITTITGFVGSLAGGAIIESGSNANGTYTKFADGTLICNGGITMPALVAASIFVENWVLPTAFVNDTYALHHSTSTVITEGGFSSAGDIVANGVLVNKEPAVCAIRVYPYKFRTTEPVVFSLTAVGRWK